MWVIFIVSGLIVALAALLIVWIGNKVYISIKRQQKKYELEDEAYKNVKDEIKKQRKGE